MSRLWTYDEKLMAKQLWYRKNTYLTVSEKMREYGYDRSPEAIRKIVRKECLLSTFSEDEPGETELVKIEERKVEYLGMIKDKFSKIGVTTSDKKTKILSLSDFHIPFENTELILRTIEEHSDADILVLNGDIMDMYSISRWQKTKSIPLRDEYIIATDYIKLFAEKFKKVVLVRGNHDVRMASYFANNLDPAISFLTHPDPLERLANGYSFNKEGKFTKLYDWDNVDYDDGICGWYAKIGKAIFAHPFGGSKIPMRTVINVANSFLDKEDYQCVVVGHSHRMGKIIWRNKLLFEQGCCCVPMDYEADASLKWGIQAFGYAVIYMDEEGNVDFNESKNFFKGSATAVNTKTRINIKDLQE